jgi:hypothetical protein
MVTMPTNQFGTYSKDDVIFLLKDISNMMFETSTVDKEEMIQAGIHYSEMLPIEYEPSEEYKSLFFSSLQMYKEKIAFAVREVAEQILLRKGRNTILVSLARAGTPIGILIKRYIFFKYNLSIPHYSISIIRGRGIDENAMEYLMKNYPGHEIQFVDGWTGKGAIKLELDKSIQQFNVKYKTKISDSLAVLADPGQCANIFGTREDFLIPNACLNSTVSGLISRTVLNIDLIQEHDFHGAKFYHELYRDDVSNFFIDEITEQFTMVINSYKKTTDPLVEEQNVPTWKGLSEVRDIQNRFEIEDINLIKPGVGETTRVLLRRIPWKILVRDKKDTNISHVLYLANERKVPIEEYQHMSYSCCGLIRLFS